MSELKSGVLGATGRTRMLALRRILPASGGRLAGTREGSGDQHGDLLFHRAICSRRILAADAAFSFRQYGLKRLETKPLGAWRDS